MIVEKTPSARLRATADDVCGFHPVIPPRHQSNLLRTRKPNSAACSLSAHRWNVGCRKANHPRAENAKEFASQVGPFGPPEHVAPWNLNAGKRPRAENSSLKENATLQARSESSIQVHLRIQHERLSYLRRILSMSAEVWPPSTLSAGEDDSPSCTSPRTHFLKACSSLNPIQSRNYAV